MLEFREANVAIYSVQNTGVKAAAQRKVHKTTHDTLPSSLWQSIYLHMHRVKLQNERINHYQAVHQTVPGVYIGLEVFAFPPIRNQRLHNTQDIRRIDTIIVFQQWGHISFRIWAAIFTKAWKQIDPNKKYNISSVSIELI